MKTLQSIKKSCWTIFKLIFPIYILVDILHYLGVLKIVASIFSPISTLIGLPEEAALALAGGGLFNLYTGIALASPLALTSHQWTIVAVFLGLFHSIVIEAAVLKKLQIPVWMTVTIRFSTAIVCSYLVAHMGVSYGHQAAQEVVALKQFFTFQEMLIHSVTNALLITLKIMALIALIIWAFDVIKGSRFFGRSVAAHSWFFNVLVGLLLGVTYGAGLLLNEEASTVRSNLPTAFFLLLCHGIIEETLLFTMFGASALPVIVSRFATGVILSSIVFFYLKRKATSQELTA